ncbi:hypothetical protein [Caminicella sporogenes]|uniref:DUF7922 domain-containing protein n=1 Tax=Caminicella sporogenes TaxID=166485 RepID=UPI0025415641|nr:hypothetical protein [Caminicella sporogenes]WIF95951.1 hypothetical protein QNI18_04920 [Caminicella sporogenes]
MVDNKRYKRYFIILENEDAGFGKEDKKVPKGYAKIEVRNGKGILNVYVQDLKYFEDGKYIYRSYLISTKEKIYVDAGSLMIDDKGKGELNWKLDSSNIQGTGKDIDAFDVIAVVAWPMKKEARDEGIEAPLAGYMNKQKVEWKSILELDNRENMDNGKDENKEEKPETQEVSEIDEDEELDGEYKEKYEEIMKTIEEGAKEFYGPKIEEMNIQEDRSTNEMIEEVENESIEEVEFEEKEVDREEKEKIEEKTEKEEVKERKIEELEESNIENYKKTDDYDVGKCEEYEYEQVKEAEEIKENENVKEENENILERENDDLAGVKEKNYRPYKKGHKNIYNKEHKRVYKYIRDALKYYKPIKPFERNIGNCRWWKISYNEENVYRNFIPFFGYVLNMYYYNPYISYMDNCSDLMNKYGHYIFGICYDNCNEPKYYVYGIPGRYMFKEQPFRGITGFVYWHPLEDKKAEKGDYGYWLLYIDAKTGNILFPLRPTIPPMY